MGLDKNGDWQKVRQHRKIVTTFATSCVLCPLKTKELLSFGLEPQLLSFLAYECRLLSRLVHSAGFPTRIQGVAMQKCLTYAGILLVSAFLFVQPSKADSFDTYQITGPGLNITFTLPSTLTPSSVGRGGDFYLSNVAGTYDGQAYTFATVLLGPTGFNNATNYLATGSQTQSLALIAPGLFTWDADGTVTLNTGTFLMASSYAGGKSYTVTVVDPPGPGATTTPEPASLVLLGVGGLALGALRRRKAA
jgi:hypothetical protein